MTTYDPMNYEIDFTDKHSRAEIRRAKRQAAHRNGQARPLQLKVVSHVDESEKPITAFGALNKDGIKLCLTFTMPNGTEGSREYDYAELLKY